MQPRTLVAIAACSALVVACSDAPEAVSRRGTAAGNGLTGPGGTTGGTGTPAGGGVSCPDGLAAPVQLATDIDAADIHVTGSTVFFRTGTKVVSIAKDGTGRKDIYTSPDISWMWTDGTTLVAVESPNPPNAELRIGAVGAKRDALRQVGTDLTAASVVFFGADETYVYAIADRDNGDVVYKLSKKDGGLETVVEIEGVGTDPQIANGSVWYVKNQTDIYKAPLTGGEPVMVTTVTKGCSLMVGTTSLFCSTDGAVEQRDLAGGSPKKLFDAQTSKVPTGFGTGLASGDGIVVRSSGDGPLKSVLRNVTPSSERVIACGRDTIGALAVAGTSVAWVETGKGVFAL